MMVNFCTEIEALYKMGQVKCIIHYTIIYLKEEFESNGFNEDKLIKLNEYIEDDNNWKEFKDVILYYGDFGSYEYIKKFINSILENVNINNEEILKHAHVFSTMLLRLINRQTLSVNINSPAPLYTTLDFVTAGYVNAEQIIEYYDEGILYRKYDNIKPLINANLDEMNILMYGYQDIRLSDNFLNNPIEEKNYDYSNYNCKSDDYVMDYNYKEMGSYLMMAYKFGSILAIYDGIIEVIRVEHSDLINNNDVLKLKTVLLETGFDIYDTLISRYGITIDDQFNVALNIFIDIIKNIPTINDNFNKVESTIKEVYKYLMEYLNIIDDYDNLPLINNIMKIGRQCTSTKINDKLNNKLLEIYERKSIL